MKKNTQEKMKLQSKLTQMTTLSFIVIIALLFVVVFSVITMILFGNLKAELKLKADANVAALNYTVSDLMKTINDFVFDLESTTDCSEAVIKKAIDSKISQMPKDVITAFYVAYGERNYLYETLGWVPAGDYSVIGRPFYDGPIQSGKMNVITYEDANTGIYAICVSMPIKTDTGEPAVIAIDMEITTALESISSEEKTEYFFVEDSAGKIIFHPNHEFEPHDGQVTLVEEARSSYRKLNEMKENEIKSIFDYNGRSYYFTVSETDNGGFRIYTGIQKSTVTNVVLLILVAGIAMVALLLYLINKYFKRQFDKISHPIVDMTNQIGEMSKGNFELHIADDDSGVEETHELQQYLLDFSKNTREMIQNIGLTLGEIANGHVSYKTNTEYIGEYSQIRIFLDQISNQLTNLTLQIKGVSSQVASSSTQVSSAANTLSTGMAEQQNTIIILADSLNEVSDNIKEYAHIAEQASNQAQTSSEMVLKCNNQMSDTMHAMEDVRAASDQIKNIVKSIEDIAGQTNLLSLNAAIEAARAGEAGKGFAVVAEEVGKLANESAEAVQNTNNLITATLAAIENGTVIAQSTADSLMATVSEIQQVLEMVEGITEESRNYADRLSGLAQSVNKISGTVEDNLAMSQESAAASEELSEQAQLLDQLVEQLDKEQAEDIK